MQDGFERRQLDGRQLVNEGVNMVAGVGVYGFGCLKTTFAFLQRRGFPLVPPLAEAFPIRFSFMAFR